MINEKFVLDLEKKEFFGTLLNSFGKPNPQENNIKCEINYIKEKMMNELFSQNIDNFKK